MSKRLWFILIITGFALQQCRVAREIVQADMPVLTGLGAMGKVCLSQDTINTILINQAEAVILFEDERYEVTITLFSRKDSIIYLSAVNSGFEILRASVDQDSIKVIDRINRTLYRTALNRRFGYQNPVNFNDLQNIISRYYLCDDMEMVMEDSLQNLCFEFEDRYIRKRIILDPSALYMTKFEFIHSRSEEFFQGERREDGFTINSNFMINDFQINAGRGSVTYNREIDVKMEVNPRKYSFVDI